MTSPGREIRETLERMLQQWRKEGLPPQWGIGQVLRETLEKQKASGNPGLWGPQPPIMFTATLDDGWGNGLKIIELCAQAAGLRVHHLGLLQPPQVLISECRTHLPDILGLTVLQLDSEEDVRRICQNVPVGTAVVAGGPVFKIDPDFVARTGVQFAARNVADFLQFLLTFRC